VAVASGTSDESRLTQGGSVDRGDRIFGIVVLVAAACVPLLLIGIVVLLLLDALPAIQQFGFGFLVTSDWDPVAEKFGAAAYIFGTVVTSLIAVLIAGPVGVACAVFVAEYAPKWLREPVSFLITLLAAIPSIIYGLWGFFVLAPVMRSAVEPFLKNTLGNVPVIGALFSGPAVGRDLLVAGVILAIMILPTITTVSREILRAVPNTQREGMLALGATRWETIQGAVLPYARGGIAGATILGLARALGETMAVTMVIGNRHEISASIFQPGYTMASLIANEFSEATSDAHLSALVAVGAVLFVVTIVVNSVARWLVWRMGTNTR
jgi:phosphate transport system permease protein